jgi:hypothetical protein
MALYQVTYTPADKVQAAARRRGMVDGDGSSFWDHVSDDEFVTSAGRFQDFDEAVREARIAAVRDVCGEARIERIVRVQWAGAPPTWETEAVWNVYDDTGELFADRPDHTEELVLHDDDCVCA